MAIILEQKLLFRDNAPKIHELTLMALCFLLVTFKQHKKQSENILFILTFSVN